MAKYITVKHTERACSFCGNIYEPKGTRSIYCSQRCKNNASKVRRGIEPTLVQTKVCLGCGKEFVTQYKRKTYCKKDCGQTKQPLHPPRQIECAICGKEVETHNLSQKTCGDIKCKTLYKNTTAKERHKMEQQKAAASVQYEMRICEICGQVYQCDTRLSNKTCSKVCSDMMKKKHKRQDRKNREHRIRNVLVDKDINLDDLRRRDKDICWICGETVDDTDCQIINGHFIAGSRYPSIDHTHPIALGGVHSWENVRLAHKDCNTKRGASMSEVVDERTREELRAYARKICPNKKEVIQFIDGVEYCRYESARMAAEINSAKEKTIQNAARGDGKFKNHRAYGYEWKYA